MKEKKRMSAILNKIDEIEDRIREYRNQLLSPAKISVDRDELLDMIDELRDVIPEEIEKYQKVLANSDHILADARKKADALLAEAKRNAESIVADAKKEAERRMEEDEISLMARDKAKQILQEADDEADSILDRAVNDSNQMRLAAVDYTDRRLEDLEYEIEAALKDTERCMNATISALKDHYETIRQNRLQLRPEPVKNSEDRPEREDEELVFHDEEISE